MKAQSFLLLLRLSSKVPTHHMMSLSTFTHSFMSIKSLSFNRRLLNTLEIPVLRENKQLEGRTLRWSEPQQCWKKHYLNE